jgi:hypothetical protein
MGFVGRSFRLGFTRIGWLWSILGLVPVSAVTVLGFLGALPAWLAVLVVATALLLLFVFGGYQVAMRYKQQITAGHLDEALIEEAEKLSDSLREAVNGIQSQQLTKSEMDKYAGVIWAASYEVQARELVYRLSARGVMRDFEWEVWVNGPSGYQGWSALDRMCLGHQWLAYAVERLKQQIGLRWC